MSSDLITWQSPLTMHGEYQRKYAEETGSDKCKEVALTFCRFVAKIPWVLFS